VEDAAFNDIKKHGIHLSLKDFFHLIDGKKNEENISEKLSTFGTRIVFTAHPTQFYPPSVLDIITRLRGLITEKDINGIDLTLHQPGLTSLINTKKPTPFDEAKNIINFSGTFIMKRLVNYTHKLKRIFKTAISIIQISLNLDSGRVAIEMEIPLLLQK